MKKSMERRDCGVEGERDGGVIPRDSEEIARAELSNGVPRV